MAPLTQIKAIHIYPLHIPFQPAFSHARMSREASDAVLVRVVGNDSSEGWGEGLPRPYVSGENVRGMVNALREEIAPLLLGRAFGQGLEAIKDIQALEGERRTAFPRAEALRLNATWCAVELTFGFRGSGGLIAGVGLGVTVDQDSVDRLYASPTHLGAP